MRLLLFTGKGGAGKTTLAAATGVHAARCGVKVLVVSVDAAHSLADVLQLPLGAQPVEVLPGLSAQQVEPAARQATSWAATRGLLLGALDAIGVDRVLAEEVTDLPGAAELLTLLEVRDQARSGLWDLIVVDCAPTADTLRLLCLPDMLLAAAARLLPSQRRLDRILTGAPLRAEGAQPGADRLVEAVDRLCAEATAIRQELSPPAASVRLVVTPEAVGVAEAMRTWTALSLYGYPVDGVLANRVIDRGHGAWAAGWVDRQAPQLGRLEQAFGKQQIARVGLADGEPTGVPSLSRLADQVYGPPSAAAAGQWSAPTEARSPLAVARTDDGFELALELPLAERSEVELGRQADDLVLAVAGRRRVIPLPAALRRCTVAGAVLRAGRLRVRFRPDPDLWRPL